jgi:hypothetical protein
MMTLSPLSSGAAAMRYEPSAEHREHRDDHEDDAAAQRPRAEAAEPVEALAKPARAGSDRRAGCAHCAALTM